ncbi:hypothetical protein BDZ90DRAFT_92595 [Jaminaea rosea]|uniref:Uncharacterized protein n=1 Tax=Jaminaea rosea TaxID=1569628 RepID=A0A316UH67_9BASI|nr:hypothetical protein BDZ90DRAFT_92595 [Jaminaea rosea]PWN24667.1 hypothetical protein BDZ90DRAFT_92595 [Jaminaea rosea]
MGPLPTSRPSRSVTGSHAHNKHNHPASRAYASLLNRKGTDGGSPLSARAAAGPNAAHRIHSLEHPHNTVARHDKHSPISMPDVSSAAVGAASLPSSQAFVPLSSPSIHTTPSRDGHLRYALEFLLL